MTGPEWIALAGVLSGAVVSVASPWITKRWDMLRLRYETDRQREDELREHLDQAAVRLTEARAAVAKAAHALHRVPPAEARHIATQAYNTFELDLQLEQVRKNADRIGVRTGSASGVSKAYTEALSGILDGVNVIATIMDGESPTGRGTEINDALTKANKAQDAFHDAASNLIGVSGAASGRGLIKRRST